MNDIGEDAQPARPPFLYEPAPDFEARSTKGMISTASYRGKWLLFFSHPADFTPVCTSELIAFARIAPRFQELGCELLALSIDGLYSHLAWLRSIQDRFQIDIPFPVVEDPSMAVARAYGMLPPKAVSSSTVRGMFLIDPDGIIKAISWYPISTGRSVEEAFRLFQAVRMTWQENLYAPADWQPGLPCVVPPPKTIDDASKRLDEDNVLDWYYQTRQTSSVPENRE
ncbi:peroxiredoxin [Burkholderia multivorans]|uniref:peroxiredoxin n=1 Tax=Burkholderia multivorans TaxID=87883 RepID=UPI000841C910|nr:peroxiredoxin [Burkholderia multivorans]AOJ94794.1 peroxiredoxin [Burkholderia multivorans]MBU9598183.1 peroxiredoxin [Burkholderia multivorans]MCA8251225.1 peroxiredoxin [Burkholderia multivorans]MDN7873401.1 peroxiredoxin [Burkholderia multivorans]